MTSNKSQLGEYWKRSLSGRQIVCFMHRTVEKKKKKKTLKKARKHLYNIYLCIPHACIFFFNILEKYVNMIFKNFSIFNSKLFILACHNFFFTKKVAFFAILSKKSLYFKVKFDIKNGFSDSFPFQKCILLYTSTL